MNIDLLLTNSSEAGLVCNAPFDEPVAGVIYDMRAGIMSLEFSDGHSLELNIPVAEDNGERLMMAPDLHVGVLHKDVVVDSRQVPLVLLNDPYDDGHNAARFPVKPRRSVIAFENFMKRCRAGQPVHRDDLGDDSQASSVLGGVNPATLHLAPNLARQKTMEAAPSLEHAPQAPAPGMGGGPGGGGGGRKPVRRSSGAATGRKNKDSGDETR